MRSFCFFLKPSLVFSSLFKKKKKKKKKKRLFKLEDYCNAIAQFKSYYLLSYSIMWRLNVFVAFFLIKYIVCSKMDHYIMRQTHPLLMLNTKLSIFNTYPAFFSSFKFNVFLVNFLTIIIVPNFSNIDQLLYFAFQNG